MLVAFSDLLVRAVILFAALACLLPATGAHAAAPQRLSPEGSSAYFEGATDANAYFTADHPDRPGHLLYRRAFAGGLQPLATNGYFSAESAAGTVVYTRQSQVPADEGIGDDLYLYPPDGGPTLLTAGKPERDGHYVGFSSLTPDRRGILFLSTRPLTDEPCDGHFNWAACDLYAWRDGQVTKLDRGHDISHYRTLRGYATDDLSTAFIGGDNVQNAFQGVPKVAFIRPPEGGPALSGYDIKAVAADRRSVILRGYEERAGLYRWDGSELVTLRAGATNHRIRVLGASPDLRRVYYALDPGSATGSGPYDLYVNVDGVDQLLSGDPTGGIRSDAPTALDREGDAALVSPDGGAIAFLTTRRLVSADTDAKADAYLAGPGALRLLTPGDGGATKLVGHAGGRVAFQTRDALTCADRDTEDDVYVAHGETLALGTAHTPGWSLSGAHLLAGGDVVFGAREPAAADAGVYRASPSTGCAPAGGDGPASGGDAPGFEHVEVALRGKAVRRCGRRRCGKSAVVVVRIPARLARAVVTAEIRAGRRFKRLLRRTVGPGTTRIALPYLPRSYRPGQSHSLRVRVSPKGEPRITTVLPLRVRR